MLSRFFKIMLAVNLTLILLPCAWAHAQEEDQIIVVSPKVGETIYRRTPSHLRNSIESSTRAQGALERLLPASRTHKPRKIRRWAILLAYGHRQGNGCGQDVKEGLLRGGLDYTPSSWLGTSSKPYGRAEYGTSTIMVRYALNRRLWLSILRSSGDYFTAGGLYHEGYWWEPSAGLDLESHLTTYAFLVEFSPAPLLRIGAGPAFHSLRVKSFGGELGNDPGFIDKHKSLGLLFNAGISLPPYSRVFVDMSMQHHLANEIIIGPFDATYDNAESPATMPPTSIPIKHTKFTLGLGIRL